MADQAAERAAVRAAERAAERTAVRASERAAERAADRARTAALLDLAERRRGRRGCSMTPASPTSSGALAGSPWSGPRVTPGRPSHAVFRYLVWNGYECVPINPNERDVLGVPTFRTLGEAAAATGPFDIVDVFRRSELCVTHALEAVATGAGCLWLQLGVVNWEAAAIAAAGGLLVVMDRCTAIEHRALRDRA